MQDAPDETSSLRLRLNELNTHLIELVATNTAGGIDDTDNDAIYAGVETEIFALQRRLAELEEVRQEHTQTSERLEEIFAVLERLKHSTISWDEKMIRQMVQWVKVLDSGRVLVVFKGGAERKMEF